MPPCTGTCSQLCSRVCPMLAGMLESMLENMLQMLDSMLGTMPPCSAPCSCACRTCSGWCSKLCLPRCPPSSTVAIVRLRRNVRSHTTAIVRLRSKLWPHVAAIVRLPTNHGSRLPQSCDCAASCGAETFFWYQIGTRSTMCFTKRMITKTWFCNCGTNATGVNWNVGNPDILASNCIIVSFYYST